jgi:hypothetical protein
MNEMDEMDDEFGVVDLDAVDDDRDVDTDAATATTPEELRRRIDRYVQLPPRSPRRAVSVSASVAPVARGAAIGAGVAAGAGVARRHPKLTLGAAILAAILAVTPAEKRPAMIKRMAKTAALLVGLAALLIGVVLLIGVNTPDRQPVTPVAPAPPTSTSSCLWGSLC